jgi:hypothetical protein
VLVAESPEQFDDLFARGQALPSDTEYVAHYHHERNHQGLGDRLDWTLTQIPPGAGDQGGSPETGAETAGCLD